MNARILKELHNLTPAAAASSVLLLLCAAAGSESRLPLLTGAFWLGCCALATAPFARDWNLGGMTMLMAQPISRDTIWREKLRAAFWAVGGFTIAFFVIAGGLNLVTYNESWTPSAAASVLLAPLFAVPVGFLIALRIGDSRAAMFLCLLAALVLAVLAVWLTLILDAPQYFELIALGFTACIAPLAYRQAKSVFHAWEDYHPLRQEYAFTIHRSKTHRSPTFWANCRALVSKELHLQQTNFLLIGGMLLCGWLIRLTYAPEVSLVTMMALIALFGPMMFGISSVCEEHRLGLRAQQNILSSSIRREWTVKFLVASGVSLLLGMLLIYGVSMLVDDHWDNAFNYFKIGVIKSIAGEPFERFNLITYTLAVAFGVALGMSVAAAFRNYLKAILFTIAVYVVFNWSIDLFTQATYLMVPFEKRVFVPLLSSVVAYLFIPVMLVIGARCLPVVSLSSSVRNRYIGTIILFLTFGFTATYATFFRSWELVTLKHSPGPAILSLDGTASFLPSLVRGSAVDENNRIWTMDLRSQLLQPEQQRKSENRALLPAIHLTDDRPVWKHVVGEHNMFVALHTNGTLWAKGGATNELLNWISYRDWSGLPPAYTETLTQIHHATDWVDLAGDHFAFHAVKSDGTLWHWGGNATFNLGSTNRHFVIDEPTQFGSDTNWKQVECVRRQYTVGLKHDGTIWRWGKWSVAPEPGETKWTRHVQAHATPFDNDFNGQIASIRMSGAHLLVRLDSGSAKVLRLASRSQRGYRFDNEIATGTAGVIQYRNQVFKSDIGKHFVLKSLTQGNHYSAAIALNTSGNILLQSRDPAAIASTKPFSLLNARWRIGEDDDWVSVGDLRRHRLGYLALKKDGTLWQFRHPRLPHDLDDDDPSIPPRWRPKQISQMFPGASIPITDLNYSWPN